MLLFFSSVSLFWVPSYFPTYLSSPFPSLNKNKMVDSQKFENLKIPLLKNRVQKTFPLGGVFCSCSWLSWIDFLLVSLNPFICIYWAVSCARLKVKLRRNLRLSRSLILGIHGTAQREGKRGLACSCVTALWHSWPSPLLYSQPWTDNRILLVGSGAALVSFSTQSFE